MFDEYAKKLEELGENVPKIFKKVSKKGAIHARNEAVNTTDRLGLVDTGAYRRNWNGEPLQIDENTYGVALQNSMEYASFLEDGHKTRGGGRYPAQKVGALALIDTEGWALLELKDELDVALKAKKYGISKSEVRKMQK